METDECCEKKLRYEEATIEDLRKMIEQIEDDKPICIIEVNENLRRVELDMELTRPLKQLNTHCEFRKKYEEWCNNRDRFKPQELICFCQKKFTQKSYLQCYCSKECRKAKMREYQRTPEYKAKQREYYRTHPEYKAKKREYYRTHPEHKAKMREYQRKYQRTPKYKAKRRKYQSTPEYKAKIREYQRRKRIGEEKK